MKKKWKIILITFLILPCVVFFGGCSCSSNTNGGGSNVKTTYTVMFYTNSSESFNIPNQTVDSGTLVRQPQEKPIKQGYSFIGWYKDQELTILWRFESDVVIQNLTLYAKWELKNY